MRTRRDERPTVRQFGGGPARTHRDPARSASESGLEAQSASKSETESRSASGTESRSEPVADEFDWRRAFPGSDLTPPCADETTVYAGLDRRDATGELLALDRRTGETRWRTEAARGYYAPPTVVGDAVLAGTLGGSVAAHDRESGQRRWTFDAPEALVSAPTDASGAVVTADVRGTVYALDPDAGRTRWRTALDEVTRATVAARDGRVYVATTEAVHGIDAETGRACWREALGGGAFGSPAVADGRVYSTRYDGVLAAHAAETGEREWQWTVDGMVPHAAAVADGRAFLATRDGRVFAVAEGETRWATAVDGSVAGTPFVLGGRAFVPREDGRVPVLDATTGERLRTLPGLASVEPGDEGGSKRTAEANPSPRVTRGSLLPVDSGVVVAGGCELAAFSRDGA